MEKIVTKKAVDRLAAIVTSKGTHYTPNKKIAQLHWEIQPTLKPIPEGCPDLRGVKFGCFTVIGAYAFGSSPTKWVVRCSCGHYETRNSKAVRNKSNDKDRCDLCRAEVHRRTAYHFNKTGKELPNRGF